MSQKTRFELRFDADLHERIRGLADAAGVSVNHLMQGVMSWAVRHAHVGLPKTIDEQFGLYGSKDEPGIWFGDDGTDGSGVDIGGGRVLFALDFTPGRAVREPWEVE